MRSTPISKHPRLNLLGAFPIARAQTPRLPPSHVSQRGPTSHQKQKPHSGPHRKTLNKTDLQGFSLNGCFSNAAYATKPGRGGNLTCESGFPAAKAHQWHGNLKVVPKPRGRLSIQTIPLTHRGDAKINPKYAGKMTGALKATSHSHINDRHFSLQKQMTGAIQTHLKEILLWR